jgi:ketosteroid isomerase-like protein
VNSEEQTLADERALHALILRFVNLNDHGTIDDFLSVVTDDIVLDRGSSAESGIDEVKAAMIQRREDGISGPGTNTRHVLGNVEVCVTGDTATGTAVWVFYQHTDATPVIFVMGSYHYDFRRLPDGWKVARRLTSGA